MEVREAGLRVTQKCQALDRLRITSAISRMISKTEILVGGPHTTLIGSRSNLLSIYRVLGTGPNTLFITLKMTFQGKCYYPHSTRRKLRWAGDVVRALGLGPGGASIATRPCLTQSPSLAPEQTALHTPGFRPCRLLTGDGGLSFAFRSPRTLAPRLARGRCSVMTMNGTFGGLNPFHVLLGVERYHS